MRRLLVLTACLLFTVTAFTQTPTITINTAQTFQTMLGWEAAAQAGQVDSPHFNTYKAALFNLAVNDLGISRLRLELKSAPTCAVADAKWTNPHGMDPTAALVVQPMRALALAAGKPFTVVLTFVPFDVTGNCTATDYANLIHASFSRLQAAHGWVPDALEIAMEPDQVSTFGGTLMGQAIVAVKARLAQSGWNPTIIAPSGIHPNSSLTYWSWLIKEPGAQAAVNIFSYHRYGDGSSIPQIWQQASAAGKQTAMLEFINADHNILYADLTIGHVSAWQQFALAYPTVDNGAQYYVVSPTGVVTLANGARYLRQYFRDIRPGAVRIGATSNSGVLAPVAFRNTDGRYVVVVKTTGQATFATSGVPAGSYRGYWTTATATDSQVTAVSISGNGSLNATIPAAGVWTWVSVGGGTPPPPQAPAITTHPATQTIVSGQTAALSVGASGATPFSYQWHQGTGTNPISGATNASFTTPALTATTSYWVRVSNASGTVDSNTATITVSATPPPPPPSSNLALNKPATGSVACNANEGPAKAFNGSVSGGFQDKYCSLVTLSFLQVDLGADANLTSIIVRHAGAGGEATIDNTRDFTIQVGATAASLVTVATVTNNTASVTTHPVSVTGRFVRLNVTTPGPGPYPATRIYELEVYAGAQPPQAPTVTTQPVSSTISSGQTNTLSVVASGTSPLTYQWHQGTSPTLSPISGATNASFTTPALTATTNYWVRVTNATGMANSATAIVTVGAAPINCADRTGPFSIAPGQLVWPNATTKSIPVTTQPGNCPATVERP